MSVTPLNDCCLGQEGAFCSMCGNDLRKDRRLEGLRRHCKVHLKGAQESRLRMAQRSWTPACCWDEGTYESRKARGDARLATTEAKWQGWVDALTEVLDAGDVDRRLVK